MDVADVADVADVTLWHVLSGLRKFSNWKNKIHNVVDQCDYKHIHSLRHTIRNNYAEPEKEECISNIIKVIERDQIINVVI